MGSDIIVPTSATPAPEIPPAPKQPALKQRFPVMTLVACAICIVVFLGLFNERNPYSWEALEKWGCYPADKIRGGAIWAFITSAFVHEELWHVGFNVYWLYVLGSRMERVIGCRRWLTFFLSAAFVSSGAEFAISDSTGIGASGVVYAIFGFMWVTRSQNPSFQKVLDPRTLGWFFLWLVGCLVMTLTKVWEVGNSSHFAGLLFGAGIGVWGLWPGRRTFLKLGFASLFLLSVVPVFWAPWSKDWTSEQGVRAYTRGNYQAAIKWYERSLSLGQDKAWCWQNIALAYYAAGDKAKYEQTLEFLRKLDEKAATEIEKHVKRAEK